MDLKPISKTRLSEAALEQIRELIVSRHMEPGSKLPSERELVQRLGISRSSVREALRMLEIMGYVEVKPGKGVYVRGLASDLSVPLPAWLAHRKESLENHFEARLVLEPAAAGLAAFRATEHDITNLTKALHTFEACLENNDLLGLITADTEFHGIIASATGNRTIQFLMHTVIRFLFEGWKATLRIEGRPRKTVTEHGAILEAIVSGDQAAAKKAMEQHLKNALAHLREAGLG